VSFTVASAQGNVGLTSGIVTPSSPTLPGSAKLALTANMWIGRLEVVPVLVFLRGLFWDVEAESE
jgi:trk system potassium uptake protein TrkH